MSKIKINFPENEDMNWIIETAKLNTLQPFEQASMKELIESLTWSLIIKVHNHQKAYAAFQSHPNIHYNPESWVDLLQADMLHSPFHGLNTIFLRIIISENLSDEDMKLILQKTFHSIPSLEYCCFVTQEQDEILVRTVYDHINTSLYDESNSYIGVADTDGEEGVGFIYATTNQIDLDILNQNFQLEAVHGLKKRHPKDKFDIPVVTEGIESLPEFLPPGFDDTEETEISQMLSEIVAEIESGPDVANCLKDLLDEFREDGPEKTEYKDFFF
ncbi:cilia-and flagella-associated protein 61 [Caerostris extrusa]|uniref:Cilia-and flagella-associated protein 61 n=1 Tax=Caerostris extrusa TaxID=172846 RepID=A0AAV4TZH7_CAEEX|nr:cilia-and flagella-associated protein 61 [Caerostris extrusa]